MKGLSNLLSAVIIGVIVVAIVIISLTSISAEQIPEYLELSYMGCGTQGAKCCSLEEEQAILQRDPQLQDGCIGELTCSQERCVPPEEDKVYELDFLISEPDLTGTEAELDAYLYEVSGRGKELCTATPDKPFDNCGGCSLLFEVEDAETCELCDYCDEAGNCAYCGYCDEAYPPGEGIYRELEVCYQCSGCDVDEEILMADDCRQCEVCESAGELVDYSTKSIECNYCDDCDDTDCDFCSGCESVGDVTGATDEKRFQERDDGNFICESCEVQGAYDYEYDSEPFFCKTLKSAVKTYEGYPVVLEDFEVELSDGVRNKIEDNIIDLITNQCREQDLYSAISESTIAAGGGKQYICTFSPEPASTFGQTVSPVDPTPTEPIGYFTSNPVGVDFCDSRWTGADHWCTYQYPRCGLRGYIQKLHFNPGQCCPLDAPKYTGGKCCPEGYTLVGGVCEADSGIGPVGKASLSDTGDYDFQYLYYNGFCGSGNASSFAETVDINGDPYRYSPIFSNLNTNSGFENVSFFADGSSMKVQVLIGNVTHGFDAVYNQGGISKCHYNIFICGFPTIASGFEDGILNITKAIKEFNVSSGVFNKDLIDTNRGDLYNYTTLTYLDDIEVNLGSDPYSYTEIEKIGNAVIAGWEEWRWFSELKNDTAIFICQQTGLYSDGGDCLNAGFGQIKLTRKEPIFGSNSQWVLAPIEIYTNLRGADSLTGGMRDVTCGSDLWYLYHKSSRISPSGSSPHSYDLDIPQYTTPDGNVITARSAELYWEDSGTETDSSFEAYLISPEGYTTALYDEEYDCDPNVEHTKTINVLGTKNDDLVLKNDICKLKSSKVCYKYPLFTVPPDRKYIFYDRETYSGIIKMKIALNIFVIEDGIEYQLEDDCPLEYPIYKIHTRTEQTGTGDDAVETVMEYKKCYNVDITPITVIG